MPRSKRKIYSRRRNNAKKKRERILHSPVIIQESTDDEINNIPDLVSTVERKQCLSESLNVLTQKTQIKENNNIHKANVCVLCDCFILGIEKVQYVKPSTILKNKDVLSVDYYNTTTGIPINDTLRNQYCVDDPLLHELLLSPRAHKKGNLYSTCVSCAQAMRQKLSSAPKYAISNGWAIGQICKIFGEIDDVMCASLAKTRFLSYVFSFLGGAHKAIKGHHTFFVNDPEHIMASLNFVSESNRARDIYTMICGRVTPAQRNIIKRRVMINQERFSEIFEWLIDNHISYKNMSVPTSQPVVTEVGGFNGTRNNTDESVDKECEKQFESSTFRFAARGQPTESTGPFVNQDEFVFSKIMDEQPDFTLLFKYGARLQSHLVKLEDIFPVIFPFGRGGLNEKRGNKVKKSDMLRHYSKLALNQLQRADF